MSWKGKFSHLCDGRMVSYSCSRHSRSWSLVLMVVDHGRSKNCESDESDAGESPSSEVTLCAV